MICGFKSRKKRIFCFLQRILGGYRIHSNNLSNNFDLHYNNLKKLLLMHVFEIQEFSDNYKLWELIEPRLKLIEIRYHYSQNILNGIRFSILELLNQKLIKSFRLVKYCIKKSYWMILIVRKILFGTDWSFIAEDFYKSILLSLTFKSKSINLSRC